MYCLTADDIVGRAERVDNMAVESTGNCSLKYPADLKVGSSTSVERQKPTDTASNVYGYRPTDTKAPFPIREGKQLLLTSLTGKPSSTLPSMSGVRGVKRKLAVGNNENLSLLRKSEIAVRSPPRSPLGETSTNSPQKTLSSNPTSDARDAIKRQLALCRPLDVKPSPTANLPNIILDDAPRKLPRMSPAKKTVTSNWLTQLAEKKQKENVKRKLEMPKQTEVRKKQRVTLLPDTPGGSTSKCKTPLVKNHSTTSYKSAKSCSVLSYFSHTLK